MKISILLLIGVICLWFFGSYQPIVVVDNIVVQNQQAPCPKCGGFGSVAVSVQCPKCNGTGKGDWNLKSNAKKTSFNQSKPPCMACRGSGRKTDREKCAPCNGTGRTANSKQTQGKTVRANLSLWEKLLLTMSLKPDANCRPQRMPGGSYPLVAKYIEITANPAYKVRVVKWETARLEGTEWIVRAEIEFMDKSGEWVRQKREFIVENREVKGTRKTD